MNNRTTRQRTIILVVSTALATGLIYIGYFSIQGFHRQQALIEQTVRNIGHQLLWAATTLPPSESRETIRDLAKSAMLNPAVLAITIKGDDGTTRFLSTPSTGDETKPLPQPPTTTQWLHAVSRLRREIHLSRPAGAESPQTSQTQVLIQISLSQTLRSVLSDALVALIWLFGLLLLLVGIVMTLGRLHTRRADRSQTGNTTPSPMRETVNTPVIPIDLPDDRIRKDSPSASDFSYGLREDHGSTQAFGHSPAAPRLELLRRIYQVMKSTLRHTHAMNHDAQDSDTRHLIEIVEQDLNRTAKVIESLAPHSDTPDSSPQSTNPRLLIEQLRRSLQTEHKTPPIRLTLDFSPDLPERVNFPSKIFSALLQLMVEHCAVANEHTPIHLSAETASQGQLNFLRIAVDSPLSNGAKHPNDVLAGIDRLEETAIALLAGQLGGHLEREGSSHGRGSIWVDLPINKELADNPEMPCSRQLSLAGRRILVADDNEINRRLLAAYLGKHDALTITAQDGHEAICLCKDNQFDVILMDLHMPGLDGNTAAGRIRHLCTNALIVAVTADKNQITEIESSGYSEFDAYLTKPVNEETLLQVLEDLITPRQHVAAPPIPIEAPSPQHDGENDKMFDWEEALRAAGGNEALAAEMHTLLLKDIEKYTPAFLDEEIPDQQLAEITHKLLGGARYCGTMRLRAHGARLEAALRGRTEENVEDAKSALIDVLQETVKAGNPFTDKSYPVNKT